jgi:hypothetical protein
MTQTSPPTPDEPTLRALVSAFGRLTKALAIKPPWFAPRGLFVWGNLAGGYLYWSSSG